MDVFETCRSVPAYEAARKAGLLLKQSGRRFWASCPFHSDSTPSMCFFQDGRFHCFSCHTGGDATAFYAAFYHLSLLEAAQRLAGDFGLTGFSEPMPLPIRQPIAADLRRVVEAWKAQTWSRLCDIRQLAVMTLVERETALGNPDACWDSELFCKALAARDAADLGLDLLSSATPAQLLRYAGDDMT